MIALDLFCCGGGAARGILAAGFDQVVGIDIEDHSKNYPGEFILADALRPPVDLRDFDFVWASPPCQAFSVALRNGTTTEKDLIKPTRGLISDHPMTVIENVPRAPMRSDVVLTGPQVGLSRLRRKRIFETSFMCLTPAMSKLPSIITGGVTVSRGHGLNKQKQAALRRAGLPVIKTHSKRDKADAMGLPVSMTHDEIGEAVPPAYAEYIAREALRQMRL